MDHSTIIGISSMATRQLVAELLAGYRAATGRAVTVDAVGGVDALKRVRAGEVFDLVILADDIIEKLGAEGHVAVGSRVAFVRSSMAIAVQAGAPRPDIGNEKAVRTALMSARSIGYSTGPSGVHLLAILNSWGVDPAAEPGRLVQAKPGVPVATLVARGEAAIGIQQLSEFLGEPGIDVVGILPPPVQKVTTFSIGIGTRSNRVEHAQAVIAHLNAPEAVEAKRRLGMEPA
jgi:molybdate transport system substrate-binding protein